MLKLIRNAVIAGGLAGFSIYAYFEWIKPAWDKRQGGDKAEVPNELVITEPSGTLDPAYQRSLMDKVVGENQPFELGTTYKTTPLPSTSDQLEGKFPFIARVKKGRVLFGALEEGTLVKFDYLGTGNALVCHKCDIGGSMADHYIYYPFAMQQVDMVQPMSQFSGFADQPSRSRMAELFYQSNVYTPIFAVKLKEDAEGNDYIEALCTEITDQMPDTFMGLPVKYIRMTPVNSVRMRRA